MSEKFSSGTQKPKQINKQKVSHARRKKKTDCGNLSDEATKENLPLLKSRDAEHGSV